MSCASSGAGPETSKYAAQQAELDKRVPDLLSQFDVPAVGIAVATPEGVALAATYGDARPGLPATNDTLFNVASVSKMLAAETVLRVAASGAFDLDAPMAPAWVDPDLVEDPRHRDLTPRHALAHQTGFPNWRSMNEDGRLVFRFDPGTQPGYSGEGFEYVARFIERTTDKTYPDIVSELVLKPSKAERIAFNNKSRWAPDFAWSKDSEGNFKPAETAPSWSAADDLYTTPTAFSRFLIPLLKGRSLPADLETDRRTIQFDMTKQFCSRPGFADICPQAIGFG
ncbi:MAG: serine hydrolase domain-containing protein, partial [Pseudomonadota bacterium]